MPLTASENYSKELTVSITQYKMFWKILSSPEIQLEIHVRATGWIALGLQDLVE